MTHALQIPHDDELVHVYHSEDPMAYEYAEKILTGRHPESNIKAAQIDVTFDEEKARIWFIPDSELPINAKATILCAMTFGWHMVFTGDVVIDGLSETQVEEYLRTLG